MKKTILSLSAAFFALSMNIMAQETKPQTSPAPPPSAAKIETPPVTAKTEDVNSVDAIVKAVYNVISGDAGVKRDWNRFRSLFYPGAKMFPTGKNKEGKAGARILTPEDYITGNAKFLEEKGFHEREIARRVEQFGNIAHVFTTYEAKNKLSDAKPFMRGINSIQLINDGSRWWVLNIAWSQEMPDAPLPEKYLKSVD